MEVSDTRTIGSILTCCMWTSCLFLLLTDSWVVKGVQLEPCEDDGTVEIAADQNTSLTCRTEGTVEWRLLGLHNQPILIATCTESVCNYSVTGPIDEVFQAKVQGDHDSIITINTENITKLYNRSQSINISLECFPMGEKHPTNSSARCGLNYVHPPKEVSCEAVHTPGSVNVSCVIGKVYSSHGIYKCRLFQRKNGLAASMGTVEMVISPTSEKIIKSEVKVSGACQFNTTVSPEEGRDDIFVSVSPGGRNYSVKITTEDYCITTDQFSGSSQQPVTEGVETHIVIAPASVSGVVVLVFILLIVGHVTRKKRKDRWRKKNHLKQNEDPIDTGNKENLPTSHSYEDPWDLVPIKLTMAEVNLKDVRLQEDESQLYDVLDYTKQKSRGNGRPNKNQIRKIEKNKGKKQDQNVFENSEYVTLGQLPWKRQAASCTQTPASSEASCARVQNVKDGMAMPGSPFFHSSHAHARAARADDKTEYSLATSFPPDPLPPPH